MICKNCGAEFPDDKKFCSNCGTKVNDAPTLENIPDDGRYTVLEYNPEPDNSSVIPDIQHKKDNKKKTGMIIASAVGAALIVVAVVLAVVFIPKIKDKKDVSDKDGKREDKVEITGEAVTETTTEDGFFIIGDEDDFEDLFKDSETETVTENSEIVTEADKTDDKVIGIWRMKETVTLDNGSDTEIVLLLRFYENGTYKIRVDEKNTYNLWLEYYYTELKKELNVETNEEVDALLAAEDPNAKLSDIVEKLVDEFASSYQVDGYWENDNGNLSVWEKGEQKSDATTVKYVVTDEKLMLGDKILKKVS